MIVGIHHVAISTPDIDRLHAFYRDVIGFETVFETGWVRGEDISDKITGLKDSSARVVMLKLGEFCLELFEYLTPEPHTADSDRPVCDHGITHLCLEVRDAGAEYARLRALGMRFHCPPQALAQGGQCTYGRDPDGNVVELLESLGQ